MKEIWKKIKGYEGLYEVSNLGRVRSLDRNVQGRRGLIKGNIKSPNNNRGYLHIHLYKANIRKRMSAHRLVALSFIPNPENKPDINHKDGKKSNNRVENLEWCTKSENSSHSVNVLLNNGHKIQCLNDGKSFNSITEAARHYHVDMSSLAKVVRGERPHVKGKKFIRVLL